MPVAAAARLRVSAAGKFFRLGERKFFAKGVAYGPFAPNAAGQPFASPEQTAADFAQIRALGANLVRIYAVPGKWFLDLALEYGLRVMSDIPWNKDFCFLDSMESREEARAAVRRAVVACARHPAVFAFTVANEIPADVVRWSGAAAVSAFIDELILEAKSLDPECLCTFSSYPSTEFLSPARADFSCYNVYLHEAGAFKKYLARLQMLAESRPLLLGELGVDSLREGEARQAEILGNQVELACRGGAAGAVVFRFTDEWWRGGPVEDWKMGLTTLRREPKPAFAAVQKAFQTAPRFPLTRHPRVSVVVASYNGDRTLKSCLESLEALRYPDFEIILVDDGSTDTTPQIAFLHPDARYCRHPTNLGLSAARNTGIAAATGEIVAFTDADCRADEDWLQYLVADLLGSEFAGVGGPNLLPPEDSPVAAAVMASPGGPAHVMLTDRQAEHIPGCNMAFYRWVLQDLGGFDPMFRKAGDDVDLCWRLQQAGYKIGFSPAAFVWHYRRSTVRDYLRQQHGYGEAEALLVRKHPEYFNSIGGSIWRGRIYNGANLGVFLRRPIIYRGLFGSAGFQALYSAEPAFTLMFCTTLEYHVLVTLPLWVLSVALRALIPVAITSLLVSLGVCAAAAAQARIPPAKLFPWSRPLVALMFFLQPIVRGWARYQGRLLLRPAPLAAQQSLDSIALRSARHSLRLAEYWGAEPINRFGIVASLLQALERHGWPHRADIGWCDYDVEVYGSRWTNLQITTVVENHGPGKQLLRYRLQPRWSLQARVGFWGVAALQVLVLGLAAEHTPLLWLLLFSLPLLALVLRREQTALQSMMIILLDEVAAGPGLTRTQPPKTTAPPANAPAPSAAPSLFSARSEAPASPAAEPPVPGS